MTRRQRNAKGRGPSGHGYFHGVGRALVDAHEGHRDMPARAQSRGPSSQSPVIISTKSPPPLLRQPSTQTISSSRGRQTPDRRVPAKACGVGFFPARRRFGDRLASSHQEQHEGSARCSAAPLAPLLPGHRAPAEPPLSLLLSTRDRQPQGDLGLLSLSTSRLSIRERLANPKQPTRSGATATKPSKP